MERVRPGSSLHIASEHYEYEEATDRLRDMARLVKEQSGRVHACQGDGQATHQASLVTKSPALFARAGPDGVDRIMLAACASQATSPCSPAVPSRPFPRQRSRESPQP